MIKHTLLLLSLWCLASCGDCEPDCGPNQWCTGHSCECYMDRYEEPDCAVAKVQRAVGNFAGLKTLNNNTPFLDTVSITSDSAAQIWLFVPEDTILVMYSNPSRGDSLLIATYRTDFTDDYWNTEGRGLVFSGTDSLYLDYTTIVGNDGIYDTTRHVFIGKRF